MTYSNLGDFCVVCRQNRRLGDSPACFTCIEKYQQIVFHSIASGCGIHLAEKHICQQAYPLCEKSNASGMWSIACYHCQIATFNQLSLDDALERWGSFHQMMLAKGDIS